MCNFFSYFYPLYIFTYHISIFTYHSLLPLLYNLAVYIPFKTSIYIFLYRGNIYIKILSLFWSLEPIIFASIITINVPSLTTSYITCPAWLTFPAAGDHGDDARGGGLGRYGAVAGRRRSLPPLLLLQDFRALPFLLHPRLHLHRQVSGNETEGGREVEGKWWCLR